MEHELAGLRRELRLGHPADQVSGPPIPGQVEDSNVELHVVGIGRKRVEANLKSLLERPSGKKKAGVEKDQLLFLGFAGAVDPELRAGHVSVPTRYYVIQEDALGDFLEPEMRMWHEAVKAVDDVSLPSTQLDSLSLDRLAGTPSTKRKFRRNFPIGVVNMEDYWIASAARIAGVPFLSVRTILDTANQSLPSYTLQMADSRTRAVLTSAALPWRIPALLRLGRQMQLAQRNLTTFALAFINRWQTTSPWAGTAGQSDNLASSSLPRV